MSHIALFHPSFGVTRGIEDAAERLRAVGHDVLIVDQYDGRTFDDYDTADAFVTGIGFPALMRRALDTVAQLPDGFLAIGFSNGGGMATHVAVHRPVAGVIICSGATPLELVGATAWPAGVPTQLHAMVDDPRKLAGAVDSVMRSVNDAGADAEYIQYPGTGHLFTDIAVTAEYDAAAAERFWVRALAFCSEHGH